MSNIKEFKGCLLIDPSYNKKLHQRVQRLSLESYKIKNLRSVVVAIICAVQLIIGMSHLQHRGEKASLVWCEASGQIVNLLVSGGTFVVVFVVVEARTPRIDSPRNPSKLDFDLSKTRLAKLFGDRSEPLKKNQRAVCLMDVE